MTFDKDDVVWVEFEGTEYAIKRGVYDKIFDDAFDEGWIAGLKSRPE